MKLFQSLLSFLFFIGFSIVSFSQSFNEQTPEYDDYDWESNPTLTDVSVSDTNVSEYVLKHKNSVEFIQIDNGISEMRLIHKKIKLLTDRGIEENNRIYIPIGNNELIFQKARVITSEGDVKLLSSNDIKQGVDAETNREYKYFAFEGIDINSEIEFMYYVKTSPSFEGQMLTMQRIAPQLNVDCEVITPEHLKFKFKSYNGFPEMKLDEEKDEKNYYSVHVDSMDGMADMNKSNTSAYKQRVIFKFDKNTYSTSADVYSYQNFAQERYERFYNDLTKDEKKIIKKLMKIIDIDMSSTESKVRSIDNYLKNEYQYIPSYINAPLSMLLAQGVITDYHLQLLTVNLLNNVGVKHQLVFTSLRTELPFDKDYENYMFLQQTMIYIPELEMYYTLDPYSRLGFPEFQANANYGLFIRKINLAGNESGIGKINYIPAVDYTKSGDTILIKMDIVDGFYDSKLTLNRKLGGYSAGYIQPVYHYIEDLEDQENFKKELIEYIDDEGEITEYSVDNLNPEDYGIVPAIVNAEITTSTFFEKAKDNFIFQVGQINRTAI